MVSFEILPTIDILSHITSADPVAHPPSGSQWPAGCAAEMRWQKQFPQLPVDCQGEGAFVLLQRINVQAGASGGHRQNTTSHHLLCFWKYRGLSLWLRLDLVKALCPFPHTEEGYFDYEAALQCRREMWHVCCVAGLPCLSHRLQAVNCCFCGVAHVCFWKWIETLVWAPLIWAL